MWRRRPEWRQIQTRLRRRTGLRSYGDLAVHACQESANICEGGRGRHNLKLFKACNYVCVMRSEKAEPCSYGEIGRAHV